RRYVLLVLSASLGRIPVENGGSSSKWSYSSRRQGQANLPFVLYPERFSYAGKSFMVQKIIALNGGVEMVSLYMRCSTEESRCYRYKRDVQWMSRNDIVVHEMFNRGVEMLSLYMRWRSQDAECSNYKLFLGKIKVLEATIEMYMHPEQHTLNSTALLHEIYIDMGKLGLE
ncbi:hypothetical protein Tco_1225523, partial [Tanacetum coccineum]